VILASFRDSLGFNPHYLSAVIGAVLVVAIGKMIAARRPVATPETALTDLAATPNDTDSEEKRS
jgi:hypothetical protein